MRSALGAWCIDIMKTGAVAPATGPGTGVKGTATGRGTEFKGTPAKLALGGGAPGVMGTPRGKPGAIGVEGAGQCIGVVEA